MWTVRSFGRRAMNEFVTAIVARKKLLAVLALCLGAVATGYFIGASHNAKGRKDVLINNTNIQKNGDDFFLVYTCKGNILATYNLTSGKLLADIQEDLFERQQGFIESTYSYAYAILGPLTQATAYPVLRRSLTLPAPQKVKYFVVGIIAMGSGLYAGYDIASHSLPNCDDDRILTKIRQDSSWKSVAKLIANDMLKQASHLANVSDESIEQRTVLERARNQINFGTVDSQLFNSLHEVLQDKYTKIQQSSQWTVADILLAAVIGISACFIGYFFAFASKAQALRNRKK